MSERKYTVKEIDELRQALEDRFVWGTTNREKRGGMSRAYDGKEMILTVEQQVRTHILAGHTAQDIYEADGKTQVETI